MSMSPPTTEAEHRFCPFGIQARDCKYQETFAKDIKSAMEGDLAFVCMLDRKYECPKLKDELGLWD